MAKKKKQTTRKRKAQPVAKERSAFWPFAGASLIIIAAFFLLLGGFNTGGPLPVGMFEAAYWAFGWGAYLTPVALAFFGYWKLTDEDRRLPFGKFASMTALLILAASLLHVSFVTRVGVGQEFIGGNGGAVGGLFGGMILGALDKVPAIVLYFVLTVLAFFLTFGISPKVLLKLADMFKRPERESGSELSSLKEKAEKKSFKLNAGVPMQGATEEAPVKQEKPRLSSLKNSAQKLAPTESHEALTIKSDPNWEFPPLNLLNQKQDKADPGDVQGNADIIKESLANFNVPVEVEGANVGPRVTQYTLKPATGVKLNKLSSYIDNLTYDLAAHSIRIEAPIPGKRAVGIEVPNNKSATVLVSNLLQSREWREVKGPLGFVIGKDIAGMPVVGDLAKMPHLLVAGQTGSGKSVMINTILTSLLYRNSPSDLKLIMVDPKQVELTPYNDIPHLLTPVINEPEKCISALKWAVAEMERRLKTMADVGRRNIAEYNNLKSEEGMPYIVIVIDELADLMMMAARDVEALIVRLAQKARAAGIHLVLATQRPSVDVITGLIKANVPARIAFTTASQVDSRTIIDQVGSEKLLGQGDMLFKTSDMPKPKRVQGAFIADNETLKVTDYIRMQRPPEYDNEIISQPVQLNGKGGIVADASMNDADDDMWRDAVQVVVEGGKASTSLLQRRLRIGYGRAARLIETMEEQGIVGSADGNRPRDVLVNSMDDVFGGGAPAESGEEGGELQGSRPGA